MKQESIQPLTIRDAELYGEAPLNEERAPKEQYVPVHSYIGLNPKIKGKSGEAYMDRGSDKWMFRPSDSQEWYRVNFDSLRFSAPRIKKKKVKA
jgi:hypothetical protein